MTDSTPASVPAPVAEPEVVKSPEIKEVEEEKTPKPTSPAPAPSSNSSSASSSATVGNPQCIISINEEGDKFELKEDQLKVILDKAAAINSKKIVIVSVVGAFRTGKSFLLDFFLRYLQWGEQNGQQTPDETPQLNSIPVWLAAGGSHLHEGNSEASSDEKRSGFEWRGGKERTTTGIYVFFTYIYNIRMCWHMESQHIRYIYII